MSDTHVYDNKLVDTIRLMERDIETTDERYYVVVVFDHFREVVKLPHERERVISMVGSDCKDMRGKEFAEKLATAILSCGIFHLAGSTAFYPVSKIQKVEVLTLFEYAAKYATNA